MTRMNNRNAPVIENADLPYAKVIEKTHKKFFFKKKVFCPLSQKDSPKIDYKNPGLLAKFLSEGKRILPGRLTGVKAKKQRKLTLAVKRSRHLALLPFIANN